MTRFESILVATDFSPAAAHAIRRGAALAELHGCPLTLLHVMSAEGSPALRRLFTRDIDLDLKTVQLRAALRRFAKEIVARHGLEVRFDVIVGDAFEEILRASKRAGLLVLGRHGADSLKDRLSAGTADRLVRTCRTPVLVVKQAAADNPYARVLVPVDFSACSEAALGMAACVSPHAAVHVFHARACDRRFQLRMSDAPEPTIREVEAMEDGETRARLRTMAVEAGLPLARVDACVGSGDACRATLDHEKRVQADLIVAGKQGRSTMADFLLGSVTRRLMAHSACDVLVLPRAAAEAWRAPVVAAAARTSPWGAAGRDGAQQRLVWK